MDYFNHINSLREQFYKDQGCYPSFLVLSSTNRNILLAQMKNAGISPRANPSSEHYLFMGAELLEGDVEGFYLENPFI
ncbi:TPA: hypothetical protein ACSE23_002784 [Acinetobacter baumannii]|uniref:hypothetical protein n=1 Tax=Acinetobacter calcoaceticus/baumannii complex TaxID=909768 RepID=UPI000B95488F|nr:MULTISPECIES: hypothetical protein [Acinetobacter calcoaceticus/baumannii complex]EKV6048998.1 hypothetical protein [Acinetobacter baumannii]ELY3911556.1 hypothetical protein [Acinetobacter baumannii]MBD0440632.1 hypothetical protein [Acinetobacter baumannii]MBP1505832.1 hypothetical protein [Acinetobacter nosocomialis]MBU3148891.1 hypothetical protein [Acinetobacter baumannii]